MADTDVIRSSIISSLFSPHSKGSAGQTGQTYISHCKTWEDVSTTGERKPRYILLAVGTTARVFLHKSKRNTNGSFSIGKTWDIIDLRTVELLDESAFRLIIGQRSYTWLAENGNERNKFVDVLIRSFRQYSQGELPQLIGLPNGDYSTSAYSNPIPSSPVTSAPLSNSNGSRGRSVNPLTSPNPSSTSLRPSTAPQGSYRSNSPSSTPRGAPSYGTPAPSVATNFTNTSSPAPISTSESSRRAHAPQLSSGFESPMPSPKLSVTQSRTSGEEETRIGGSPNSKVTRPKISIAGLTLNHRSHSRTTPPVPDSPAFNRIISSPLRPNQDRYATKEQRPSTAETLDPARQSVGDGEQDLTSSVAVSKPARPPPAKSAFRSRDSLTAEKSLTPPGTSEKIKIVKQPEETDFDIPDVLSNVEEILEGFQWRAISSNGPAESVNQIEDQLMTELKALELAEIHAIIENDDRVGTIVTHLDESLAELDKMEALLSLYRTQLNMVDEDIVHIESQNRGLQVQISNQRVLLEEIEDIMQTIRIPDTALDALTQEPLDSQKGIDQLEKAATSLYKAILSVKDMNNITAVAAASDDKVEQYKRNAQQFCKRVYEFLIVMFKYQAGLILNDKNNIKSRNELKLPSHSSMEKYLERYCGLTLFTKEIDAVRYQQLCASYFTTASELHKTEILEIMSMFRNKVRKPNEEELEATFAAQLSPTTAKMMVPRNPLSKFEKRDKKEANSSTDVLTAGEALRQFLTQLIPHVQREQNFVIDFLHVHSGLEDGDGLITYAGYSGLEGYFKRAAVNLQQTAMLNSKLNDILSVMDLIFGFLPGEMKEWVEAMVAADPMQIISVMMALDLVIGSDILVRSEFLNKILEAQQKRSLNIFELNIKEQLKAIETTRLTVKKRKGVVSFISTFPDFVLRVERQMEFGETADCPTRKLVNQLYEQISQSMFEALQTMAKSEGDPVANSGGGSQEDRDKDRLNYHTLIIENMHHFVTTVSKINAPALKASLEKAKEQYDHNLALYIRLVLRRPLARFIDYFQGIDELLRTTEPTQIPQHSQYTRASLKRVISTQDKKDIKKSIETLSKRVDKHFSDVANPSAENSVVMETVWSACEKELIRLIGDWQALLEKCYANPQTESGTSGSNDKGGIPKFEFGIDDVKLAFQKYRPGS
ncbi:hypothetical protein PGT21_032207 [Puccinia graminis f. sp. tritici]|uniref:Exocyst complex component Sec3 PIP2-binding N-terminal domain-containing protein n=2 Tax=Puccinia graminis f. sp. tritici TaxID=56615 RepID=E3K429_PUCGT|nr:uncharacterized protein PGTG_04787 [Puccinia graminis f. sp. tritici CRL 75-36-700-3]EFP78831.2 hypothetical protein PGTG_04787 [Puccinia graminis f. sp. tritici CRL 75-36-700-3]KAA1069728.1 hypothetical protein PGT21_032207 [Puccinia graminis f. sp. tritici]